MRVILLTSLALVAFAANSVLCRMALGDSTIDAASFSTIRLCSGAITLFLIVLARQRKTPWRSGSWTSAAMLFLYAVPFSFAYISLSTATGALILFGAVQLTMMVAALWSGERPHALQWVGLILALAGLVYLVFPGLEAPPLSGAALMAVAGFGWGVYSLRGRGAANPLAQTASNFARSVPMVIAVSLVAMPHFRIELEGALLAVTSGAVTSGIGYAVWYAALGGLTATRAAVVQLSVPIITAAGGVAFLAESITPRLVVATFVVLGGVGLALAGRERLDA